MNALESLNHNRKQFNKAWMIGDVSRMKSLIVRAATFATMTIRTRTKLAEERFAKFLSLRDKGYSVWFALSQIKGLMATQKGTIIQLHLLSDADIMSIINAPYPEKQLGSLIKGLGCAKTSFSLACAGFGKQGCIDVHHERQYRGIVKDEHGAIISEPVWNNALRRGNFDAYYTLTSAIWGKFDSAIFQWQDWLDNLVVVSGYQTNHAILTQI